MKLPPQSQLDILPLWNHIKATLFECVYVSTDMNSYVGGCGLTHCICVSAGCVCVGRVRVCVMFRAACAHVCESACTHVLRPKTRRQVPFSGASL